MKRTSFFVALFSLLVLSFGLANAQPGNFTLEITQGAFPGDPSKVACGQNIRFQVYLTNTSGTFLAGIAGGWRVYTPDGAAFTAITADWNDEAQVDAWLNFIYGIDFYSADGIGADTVKIAGNRLNVGIPDGTISFPWAFINTQLACTEVGKTICIDSTWAPPTSSFGFIVGSPPALQKPLLLGDGYGCFTVDVIPNLPPTWTNKTASISGSHCGPLTFDFDAVDQDLLPNDPPVITYSISGPGSINASTGAYTYAPSLADVGASLSFDVTASDGQVDTTITVSLNVTNQAPVITCPAITYAVGKGGSIDVPTSATDDCDPISFSIANVVPAPVGTVSVNPSTGLVTFDTDDLDGGNLYVITVEVTDGVASTTCDVEVDVLLTEPFLVRIEKTHGTFQGQHEFVDVSVDGGSELAAGFDFLIAYDASALSFQGAIEGSIYTNCGWEYFTYRFGPDGNCSNACPSGLLRVVGIAETNNGPNHPTCFDVAGETLFTLDFLVTDDRTFECQYAPIRFFWMDCGDNSMSSINGDTLFISRGVYDYEAASEDPINPANDMADGSMTFPTYFGAPDVCEEGDKVAPIRFIDFANGGVDIVCADSIDARGDLNLNGEENEIADAVMYSNYFVKGLGVFTINVQGQIAASDVNADGLTLSVADLVYLIRIVIGDALPYAKIAPVNASVVVGNGVVAVDADMGAAALTVRGDVTPQLLADNMEIKYAFDAEENVTKILVYSMEKDATFNGEFVAVNGTVESIELATYDGAPVSHKLLPANFALNQNYPNPFNPSTTISFELPKATAFTVEVFNVAGQKVASHSDFSEAGTVEWEFQATDLASGVYFYKLTAGDFSATNKMVLLK
jgi:hypothetical protein